MPSYCSVEEYAVKTFLFMDVFAARGETLSWLSRVEVFLFCTEVRWPREDCLSLVCQIAVV